MQVAAPLGFRLATTAKSHGWYDLPPFAYDADAGRLSRVLTVGTRVLDVAIVQSGATLEISGADKKSERAVVAQVRSMLRLDEDLAPLYALSDEDPHLAYARQEGAGRLLRAPTMFEDVIKMLLTTNCSWSFTRQMVGRLVEQLGSAAPSGQRAFPTPAQMAAVAPAFYRDQIRAGYRAPHLAFIAREVAAGKLDLESLRGESDDPETLRKQLMALPGIGPYAADNLLRLVGAYGYLGLDSWCRGKLKQLYPRTRDVDAGAHRRYRRYGAYQGLAMWLDLTRDWHV